MAGCMMANFYLVRRQRLDLNQLYMNPAADNTGNPYFGLKKSAYAATLMALILCLLGHFIPALSSLSNISWFVGFLSAAILYVLLERLERKV